MLLVCLYVVFSENHSNPLALSPWSPDCFRTKVFIDKEKLQGIPGFPSARPYRWMQVTLYYAAIWVWFGCSVIGKVWSLVLFGVEKYACWWWWWWRWGSLCEELGQSVISQMQQACKPQLNVDFPDMSMKHKGQCCWASKTGNSKVPIFTML